MNDETIYQKRCKSYIYLVIMSVKCKKTCKLGLEYLVCLTYPIDRLHVIRCEFQQGTLNFNKVSQIFNKVSQK